MALLAKASGGGGDFKPVPAATHIARCITVCDIGLQESGWGMKEKVYLGFEVPAVRVNWTDKDGVDHEGAALIGSTYTLSIHKKSILGQHLITWRGKDFTQEERDGFDLFKILGAPCMLSVTHNESSGNTYANISGIMRIPQGTVVPKLDGELIGYTPLDPQWAGNLGKLPEWLQKKASEGQRQQTGIDPGAPPPPGTDFDDDIPFAFVLPTLLGLSLAASEITPMIA